MAARTAALSEGKAQVEAARCVQSRFLAHMSHELRTPPAGIIGMTGLARGCSIDVPQREQLAKAEQASQHLLRLIKDLLDPSRMEAERLVREAAPFRLQKLFDDQLHLAAHRAHDKRLVLGIELDPALADCTLVSDALRAQHAGEQAVALAAGMDDHLAKA